MGAKTYRLKYQLTQFDAVHYGGLASFKLTLLVFNLVPYLALRIVAS